VNSNIEFKQATFRKEHYFICGSLVPVLFAELSRYWKNDIRV